MSSSEVEGISQRRALQDQLHLKSNSGRITQMFYIQTFRLGERSGSIIHPLWLIIQIKMHFLLDSEVHFSLAVKRPS